MQESTDSLMCTLLYPPSAQHKNSLSALPIVYLSSYTPPIPLNFFFGGSASEDLEALQILIKHLISNGYGNTCAMEYSLQAWLITVTSIDTEA